VTGRPRHRMKFGATGETAPGAVCTRPLDLNSLRSVLSLSAMPSCGFCKKFLPTSKGVRVHMRQRASCRKKRSAWLKRASMMAAGSAGTRAGEEGSSSEAVPRVDGGDGPEPAAHADEAQAGAGAGAVQVNAPREATPTFDDLLANVNGAAGSDAAAGEARGSRVEDVAEEEGAPRFVQPFPAEWRAGVPISDRRQPTLFELMRDEALQRGEVWGPFESEDEVELARWLFDNVGMSEIDNFLRLRFVRLLPLTITSDSLIILINS
jgi:hypothetical protein